MSELAQSIADRPESLVTVLGAAGFVGSAVVAELARLRLRLRLVSRERSLPPPPPPSLVESRTADLAEAHAVRDVVTGSDAIIHLATDIGGKRPWRAPGTDFERLNAGLINTLVESARQCSASPPVVVFASTIQASAPPERRVGEYVRQKMAAEDLLRQATSDGYVRGIVLRLATVYGRSPLNGSTGHGVLASMARKAAAGEPITLWHDGSIERDFLHVTDAARAFVTAIRHVGNLSGGSWPVGTGRPAHLADVFRSIAGIVADRTGARPVPIVSVDPPTWADATDFDNLIADPAAFTAATGWRPLVPLAEGLSTMVEAIVGSRTRSRS